MTILLILLPCSHKRGINQKNKTGNHLRGKTRLLNCQQLEKLKEQIEQTPPDGGIWTGVKVARWIEKETRKKQSGKKSGIRGDGIIGVA